MARAKSLVFVYGSLRQGMGNHYMMEGTEFIGTAVVNGYRLLDVGAFPAVIVGEGEVVGEVYEVKEADLARLDRFEGCPSLYVREEAIAKFHGSSECVNVFIYRWNKDASKLRPIKSGDYVFYRRKVGGR